MTLFFQLFAVFISGFLAAINIDVLVTPDPSYQPSIANLSLSLVMFSAVWVSQWSEKS